RLQGADNPLVLAVEGIRNDNRRLLSLTVIAQEGDLVAIGGECNAAVDVRCQFRSNSAKQRQADQFALFLVTIQLNGINTLSVRRKGQAVISNVRFVPNHYTAVAFYLPQPQRFFSFDPLSIDQRLAI